MKLLMTIVLTAMTTIGVTAMYTSIDSNQLILSTTATILSGLLLYISIKDN